MAKDWSNRESAMRELDEEERQNRRTVIAAAAMIGLLAGRNWSPMEQSFDLGKLADTSIALADMLIDRLDVAEKPVE